MYAFPARVFITACVVLVQLQVTPVQSEVLKVEKGVTLTFVFDSTGSMADELQQVKDGTQAIFKTMYEHPDKPIYNYALVPFNDPDVGPPIVTTDPVYFNNSLKAITIDGGGDCPELAMSGIKLGVEISRPGSYIYVFTDASAKDHYLEPEVENLIQRKYSQIVIVMTGECSGYSDPGYLVFEKIASASAGQVFNIKKQEVKDVLNYVKESVQERNKVVVVSVDKPSAGSSAFSVPVDATMVVLNVALSGRDPKITVIDNHGVKKEGVKVLDVPGGLVVKVLNPEPGTWLVDTSSSSAYSVRITTVSEFSFIYGFSTIPTTNMAETAKRPLGGAETAVLVKVTNQTLLSHLTKMRIKDLSGTILHDLPLIPVPGHSDFYRVDKFTPPTKLFYLEVHGEDKVGKELIRTSPTAVSPQPPAPPTITIPIAITAAKNGPFDIKCHVESLIPFTATWLKDGRAFGSEESFKQSSEVLLHLPNVTGDSEGKYTCNAKNVAGTSSESTQLTVTAPPPKVETPDKIVVQPGKKEEIKCLIESELPYTVSWSVTPPTGSPHLISDPRFEIKATGNLVIDPVQIGDEGTYQCTAESKVGKGEDQVYIQVREPVAVKVTPRNKTFLMGEFVSLSCSATGDPELHLTWKKDGRLIEASDPRLHMPAKDTLDLLLENMESSEEGRYECEAENGVDKDVGVAELVYEEFPTATVEESYKKLLRGTTVLLSCTTSGVPKPDVFWSVNGRNISTGSEFEMLEDNVLRIPAVASGGDFKCTAVNKVGSAEDIITLDVGSVPEFVVEPNDTEVEILSDDTIPCQMAGDPKPTVNWRREDGETMDDDRFTYNTDSCTLEISGAEIKDEGVYIVTLENKFGMKEKKANITITGIVNPVLDKSDDPNVSAVSSEFHELTCKVLEGYPDPTIDWYKDGELVDETLDGIKVEANGSLIIPHMHLKNAGDYECEASNVGGKAKKKMKVTVQELPVFSHAKHSIVKVRNGKDVQLPCVVQGNPKPVVVWKKDGAPLTLSSRVERVSTHDSLVLRRAREADNGTYECIATNSAGVQESIIEVLVHVPPKIAPATEEMVVRVGDDISLQCDVNGFPPAEIKWQKDGLPLSADDVTYSEDSSSISFTAKSSDGGQYECIATNIAGKDKFITRVTVMVPPQFEVSKEVVLVNQGEDVTLICYTDAIPPAEYFWNSRIDLGRNDIFSSSLTLNDVQPSVAGAYFCEASNYAGTSHKVFYVKVNVPPKILSFTERETLVQGTDYSLACQASGSPLPEISWKKDGKIISTPHTEEEHVLIIKEANQEDSGLYTCTAVNSAGIDHRTLILNVLVPPVMKEAESAVREVKENADSVIISCPAIEANPPPSIHWFKDRSYLNIGTKKSRRLPKDGGKSLKIRRITKDDEGVYTCLAVNEAGRTSADITVKVLIPPKFVNSAPLLTRNELIGASIMLDCSSTGLPEPKVTWYRNGNRLLDSLIPGLEISADNHILQIPNLKFEDAGDYVCLSENKVGKEERAFTIKVFVPEPRKDSSEVPEWSSWGRWSPCSASCGISEKVRTRRCSSETGGCEGSADQWRKCFVPGCQANGAWSKWTAWSTCSTTCGIGQRKRYRKCKNPPPRNGGALCRGGKEQQEICNPTPCPINGAWSEWSDWKACSGPCSNSTRHRTRQCSEPSPAFGGADCEGYKAQYIPCTQKGCPVDGQWSDWSLWSSCSASCGPSISKRSRACNEPEPKYGGVPCTGESIEIKECPTTPCDGIPLYASIKIRGTIYGQTFRDVIHRVQVSDKDSLRTVEVSFKDILKRESVWFPYLQYFVSPLVWITAFQKDGSSNGYTLTQGHFQQITHIVFDSGEKLVLKHTGLGVGPDGIQQLDVEVNGDVPFIPIESIAVVEPYEEDYVQIGPDELFASSSGTLNANGLLISYVWNKTITYNSGTSMPY
ncbi:hemicentin-1 isoform X2 [Anabrus simplex]